MTDRMSTLAQEQRAVDYAYTCYERRFATNRAMFKPSEITDAHAGTAFIPDVAPEVRFEGDLDGEALVIARVDVDEDGDTGTWYIGRRNVRDEAGDSFVVNWQAPQATEWLLRRPNAPGGMTLRRRLRCDRDRVKDFQDEIKALLPKGTDSTTETTPAAPPVGLKDFLLEDLERARDGRMRDIVETIQQEQLLLVSDQRQGVLVVQGGPGTGKTAVGLHRISWLLYNRRFRTGEILVVGPHRRFLDYVRGVLPRLGTRDVTALELSKLWDAPRGADPLPARSVKSDARMAEVLRRAVENLPGEARMQQLRDRGFVFLLDGARLAIPGETMQAFATGNKSGRYADRRNAFATRLVDHLMLLHSEQRPRRADQDIRHRIAQDRQILKLVNRVWPNVTAERVLRDLLGDPAVLRAAADEVLTAEEQAAITRAPAPRADEEPWSLEDRVCLEELRVLLTGDDPPRYRHIMVDEAQDLTPMQARSLARRCPSGSMTVLGDLAQATGDHSYEDWSLLGSALAGEDGWHLAELTVGYRVPKEVMEFAEVLGRSISPSTPFPRSIRPVGPGGLTLVPVETARLRDEAVARARSLLTSQDGRSVAVIVPDAFGDEVPEIRAALPGGERATVITAAESKGLEFDHVVLVEPAEVAARTPGGHGLLYVAVTRCTRSLVIVHSAPLPPMLRPASGDSQEGDPMIDAPAAEDGAGPAQTSFGAFIAELEATVRQERRSTVHEGVRYALISELYGAGLIPTVDSSTADVICDSASGKVLYEVLGEGGNTYARMRDAVLRILEVQHAEGEPAEHRFLVLPEPPAEPWAPEVLAEAFGMSVIWRAGDRWAGRELDIALGRMAGPGGR
ncbi:ATP-binding domain-containing protein [Actinomadura sp. NPDC049753]|uniref:HelD family protein n=1 Tax=Actinomadura sp. NPDC049753 TaxID=3154739 RepID=UPI00342C6EB9